MAADILQTIGIMVGSAGLATALMIMLAGRLTSPTTAARRELRQAEARPVFLFEGPHLVDATKAGWRTMRQAPEDEDDLGRLTRLMLPRFPDLLSSLKGLEDGDKSSLPSNDGTASLALENWDGLTRISLLDTHNASGQREIDQFTLDALENEVQTLRAIAEDTPHLIWQADPDGKITWANAAYLALSAELSEEGASDTWPPKPLFPTLGSGPYPKEGLARRISVSVPGQDTSHWFDTLSLSRGVGSVHFATNSNEIVRAENAQRTFVQTLTKTFAQLSIGLAIFDKDRHLALFNPALLDLVSLPVEFLSQRPTLVAFLDELRQDNLMPEPKNYRSWRDQIAALEAEAENGTYCETWSLPGGITYRVTGRPHPDGAIAFLFEDISAEVSLNRRFRSEIDLGRNVIDAVGTPISVFRPDGVIVLANDAYGEMWPGIMDSGFIEQSILDASKEWQAACEPSPVWGDVRDFVRNLQDREPWSAEVERLDGAGPLLVTVKPLPGGDTMVGFTEAQPAPRAEVKAKGREMTETSV